MESEKRRMLDPRVIRGKKMERGESETRKEMVRIKREKHSSQATRSQWISLCASVRHMKLIGVYFISHVKCPVWHILADGCTTSQPLSHVPSFNLDKDEDTKKLGGLVSSKRTR